MVQFGLCCLFVDEPIRFRTATAKALFRLSREQRLEKLSQICLHNATGLLEAARRLHRSFGPFGRAARVATPRGSYARRRGQGQGTRRAETHVAMAMGYERTERTERTEGTRRSGVPQHL